MSATIGPQEPAEFSRATSDYRRAAEPLASAHGTEKTCKGQRLLLYGKIAPVVLQIKHA